MPTVQPCLNQECCSPVDVKLYCFTRKRKGTFKGEGQWHLELCIFSEDASVKKTLKKSIRFTVSSQKTKHEGILKTNKCGGV